MPASGPSHPYAMELGDKIADEVLRHGVATVSGVPATVESIVGLMKFFHVDRPVLPILRLPEKWDEQLKVLEKALKDYDNEAIRTTIKELVWTCHCEW